MSDDHEPGDPFIYGFVIAILLMLLAIAPSTCFGGRYVPTIRKFGEWDRPPVVRVCASAPVGVQTVRHAMRQIERHGGRFGGVTFGPCERWPDDGWIWVTGALPGVGGTVLGATIPLEGETGHIRAAIVSLADGIGAIVVRHELLHALGIEHTDEIAHIMAPSMILGGPSWAGIREAFRGPISPEKP